MILSLWEYVDKSWHKWLLPPLEAKGTYNKKGLRVKNKDTHTIHGKLDVLGPGRENENSKSPQGPWEKSDYEDGDFY